MGSRERCSAPPWLTAALGSRLHEPRNLEFLDAFGGPRAGLATAFQKQNPDHAAASYDLQQSEENDVLCWSGFLQLALLICRVVEGQETRTGKHEYMS